MKEGGTMYIDQERRQTTVCFVQESISKGRVQFPMELNGMRDLPELLEGTKRSIWTSNKMREIFDKEE